MPRLADAGQALDVEVDQVAGALMFIADHGRWRVKRAQAVHSGTAHFGAFEN
jgi:hypothetical protein